jgi:hypothetical protein
VYAFPLFLSCKTLSTKEHVNILSFILSADFNVGLVHRLLATTKKCSFLIILFFSSNAQKSKRAVYHYIKRILALLIYLYWHPLYPLTWRKPIPQNIMAIPFHLLGMQQLPVRVLLNMLVNIYSNGIYFLRISIIYAVMERIIPLHYPGDESTVSFQCQLVSLFCCHCFQKFGWSQSFGLYSLAHHI